MLIGWVGELIGWVGELIESVLIERVLRGWLC